MKQYYFSNGQEPNGPFTLEQLAKQPFTAESIVWHEGMSDWLPAKQISELSHLFPAVPPIRRAPVGPPSIPSSARTLDSGGTAPFAAPPATSQQSSPGQASRLKYYLIGGGVLALLLLFASGLLGGFFQSEATYSPAYTATEQAPTDAAIDANGTPVESLAPEVNQEQVQQQEREAKRAWNREHFLEFFNVFVNPTYSVGTLGGISGGSLTVQNKSGYRLENVVVTVYYYKPNGETINARSLEIGSMAAHEEQQVPFPNSDRGIRVDCQLFSLTAPGLEYEYNVMQQE